MKNIFTETIRSIAATVVFVIILCGLYPLVVYGAGQLLFKHKADGSIILSKDGKVIGSEWLAQNFTSAQYFHPRPSAAGNGYDPTSSGGTNLGPTSDKLINGVHVKDAAGKDVDDPSNFDGVKDLVAAYRTDNGLKDTDLVPADAVTRSGSGLDPHISVKNANIQVARVAKARNLDPAKVKALVDEYTDGPSLGIFGDAGVNVLKLNLALDALAAK
jgi:potassium-transporting ATPase KdpC subunit